MALVVILIVLAVILGIMLDEWALRWRARKLPPSPPRLPLAGNLHLLKLGRQKTPLSLFSELGKRYGPVTTLWMGRDPWVVVNGHKAVWEGLVTRSSDFAGRVYGYSRGSVTADRSTSIFTSDYDTDDERWAKLRRILHKQILHHLAFLHRDVVTLVNKLELSTNGPAISVMPFLKSMAATTLARMCFGQGFDDQRAVVELERLATESVDNHMQTITLGSIYGYFFERSEIAHDTLKQHVEKLIVPLVEDVSVGNCYVGALLRAREQGELDATNEEIAFNVFEIFFLGVDSTATAMEWALAYFVAHPEMQNKASNEIQTVTPRKKDVAMEDVSKLTYLEAVLKEVLRMHAIAPFAIPHRSTRKTILGGFVVPANTTVLFNIDSVAHDPELWGDDEHELDKFKAQRFMKMAESKGKERVTNPMCENISFGAGRRQCAGMELANMLVPLTVANLLKAFEWTCETSPPDLTPYCPFMLRSLKKPLRARIVHRALC